MCKTVCGSSGNGCDWPSAHIDLRLEHPIHQSLVIARCPLPQDKRADWEVEGGRQHPAEHSSCSLEQIRTVTYVNYVTPFSWTLMAM